MALGLTGLCHTHHGQSTSPGLHWLLGCSGGGWWAWPHSCSPCPWPLCNIDVRAKALDEALAELRSQGPAPGACTRLAWAGWSWEQKGGRCPVGAGALEETCPQCRRQPLKVKPRGEDPPTSALFLLPPTSPYHHIPMAATSCKGDWEV